MQTPSPEFWATFKKTPGAFSSSEALCLYNICHEVPDGLRIELGTNRGKSALTACAAFSKNGNSNGFVLVEPEFTSKEWLDDVNNTLLPFVSDKMYILCEADFSQNVIPKYESYAYVFCDSGDHGDELINEELRLLSGKIIKGGIFAFHDYKNQFTAVQRAYDRLVASGEYEPININWGEIFDYVKEHDLENGNDSWHQYPELSHPPNFVGALRKK